MVTAIDCPLDQVFSLEEIEKVELIIFFCNNIIRSIIIMCILLVIIFAGLVDSQASGAVCLPWRVIHRDMSATQGPGRTVP